MSYGYKKQVSLGYEEAIAKTKEALKLEGFGVLTEIDVKATLKKKLDIDTDEYIILGACNPTFAHKALEAEKEIGLLLPCNIIVYVEDGNTFVSAINPIVAMSVVDNDSLGEIAKTVTEKLQRVVNSL